MKFLVLLLVVVVGVAWLVWGRRRPPSQPKGDAAAPPPAPAKPGTPQAMLACAHCGTHLPEADTLRDGEGRTYCSEAHRRAGPGGTP
jgi:uncharacterized protein